MQYVEGLNGETASLTAAYPRLQQKRHELCELRVRSVGRGSRHCHGRKGCLTFLDHARKEFGQLRFEVGAGIRKHLLAGVINGEGRPARKFRGQMVERLG